MRLSVIDRGDGMHRMKELLKRVALGSAIFFAVPATVYGQEASAYRDTIRQYQLRYDQLKADASSRYNADMSQIASWIDESLILIGKNEGEKVKSLSTRLGVYVDFVESSVARDKAMGAAMEAESKLKALKAEYGKLEAQVQQMAAEEEKLSQQLNSKKQ